MSRTEEYFDTFIVRNFRSFWDAEARLVSAVKVGEPDALQDARAVALVAGMNAAVPAYHLADTAIVDRPAWVPASIGAGRGEARKLCDHVEKLYCVMLRSTNAARDLTLLGDVVDAYKHAELTNRARLVSSSKVTVIIGSGWGEMHWGEGNYGGLDQVIVLTDQGKRALSAILQNVIDMWRTVMGLSQQPVGR